MKGETQLFGFYTTRKVKASDEKQAELLAVELIKKDPALLAGMDRDLGANPMIYLESISKLRWWSRLGGIGYTFFPMEEE